MLEKLPSKVLTGRGWGLCFAGVAALVTAEILGRRDLLHLGFFLLLLPLLAALALHLLKPRFTVGRTFQPLSIETDSTTTVRLSVGRSGSLGGIITMTELLPQRFGEAPSFNFPSRSPGSQGQSLYEYKLRSSRRGLYKIGPVSAEFGDPFGLSRHQNILGDVDRLTVTPAPLVLPETAVSGSRGTDGATATRTQANPSNDDVMTREYRHGDPMRRVHWPATARHGELMVRQEESVTTPQATIILDQRGTSFSTSAFTSLADSTADKDALLTTVNFEWAVTAAVSIAHHLVERNYAVRLVDSFAAPGLRRSASSPWPEEEEFSGTAGLHNLSEGLAALELESESAPAHTGDQAVFGDIFMDKLALHKLRGPLIAITGQLSENEARQLASVAEFGSHAFALVVVDKPHDAQPVLDILRHGGWRAVGVDSTSSLPSAWSYYDAPQTHTSSTARTTIRAKA